MQQENGIYYVVRATTVVMQWCGKHTFTTIEGLFSAWSMPRNYLEDIWRYSSFGSSGAQHQPEGKGVSSEAEESPLSKFVTRKRLVKTLLRNSHCSELLPSND
jgi:hypothetical protein